MRSKLLKVFLGLVVLLIVTCVALVVLARPAAHSAYFVRAGPSPQIMAHRGGSGLWPENTLYAFERAVALGVDVLEMDIHSTADGVLVVIHDSTVDRTTDGTGPVQALTLAELKALDAGYRWSSDGSETFPYQGLGLTVPSLEEVFSAFPQTPMNIEIKQTEPAITVPLCRLIREWGMVEWVLVASFDQTTVEAFRRECPQVATSTAEGEVILLFALSKVFLEATYSPQAGAVQVPEYRSGLHVLTPRFVAAAHRRGLQVHAWTINDPDDMQRLVDLGVDGIITDHPDRLQVVLGR
jgi:glycerophosphoryl diester phosphodiesterase